MARLFDGSVDDVAVPRSAALEPAFPLALGCWVLSAAPDSFRYLVSKVAVVGDHPSYGLGTNGSGEIRWIVATGSGFVISPTSAAPWDGAWHHVLGTYDGAAVRLYVDGAEVGTGTANTDAVPYNTGEPLHLGSFDGSILHYPGRLADVALWAAVPAADERAALARGVPASRVRPGALRGYWPLYGVAGPEPDLSGNGGQAVLVGTTAVAHAPVGPYVAPLGAVPPLPASTSAVSLGQAAEVDTATALVLAKTVHLGQATEVDTALALANLATSPGRLTASSQATASMTTSTRRTGGPT